MHVAPFHLLNYIICLLFHFYSKKQKYDYVTELLFLIRDYKTFDTIFIGAQKKKIYMHV